MVGPPPAERRSRRDLGIAVAGVGRDSGTQRVDVIDEQLSALANQDYLGPFGSSSLTTARPTRCVATSTIIRWPTVSVFGGSTPRDFPAPPMRATRVFASRPVTSLPFAMLMTACTRVVARADGRCRVQRAVGGRTVKPSSIRDSCSPGDRCHRRNPLRDLDICGCHPPAVSVSGGRCSTRSADSIPVTTEGAEDADLAIRIQLAGGVLGHAPKALVAYRLRDTLRGIWSQSVMCGKATRTCIRLPALRYAARQVVPNG